MFMRVFAATIALSAAMLGPECYPVHGQAVLAEIFLQGADSARDAGDTATAARLYVLALTEAHGQEEPHLIARALVGAAIIHAESGEGDVAEDNLRAALSLYETFDAPAIEVSAALNCLAIVYFDRGAFEQAEACYAKLLNDLDPDDADQEVTSAVLANNLALVKAALDKTEAAIELAEFAAQIMADNFGPDSAHYAQCLDTLAQALAADGSLDEAAEAVKLSREICAADIGEESAQYGTTLLTHAKIQSLSGKHADAAQSARRSLELLENAHGGAHRMTQLAREALAAIGQASAVQAETRRLSANELKMFTELYGGLGLADNDLAALFEHWQTISGPERMGHYLDFEAEVAARRQKSTAHPPRPAP